MKKFQRLSRDEMKKVLGGDDEVGTIGNDTSGYYKCCFTGSQVGSPFCSECAFYSSAPTCADPAYTRVYC